MLEQYFPKAFRVEWFRTQGRILPAKTYLRLFEGWPVTSQCDLDIWVLHQNGTHMARYLPGWNPPRAWVSKLRPLHAIKWEGISMYAPFPAEAAIKEEFGGTWATPIDYTTWHHNSTKDNRAHPSRTSSNEMKDTVFVDCGYQK